MSPCGHRYAACAGQSLRLVVAAGPGGAVVPAVPAVANSMYRFLTPEVGDIDRACMKGAKGATIMRMFAPTKGIVMDQRNYPGEAVPPRGYPV